VDRIETVSNQKFVPSSDTAKASTNDVDVWILAATFGLVQFVHQEMKSYRLYTVVPRLVDFIEQLTNWYVRLNRDRLKGVYGENEALLGLNVLYEVLITMTLIMSPFTPFFAEYLYQHLRKLTPYYKNTDPKIPVDTMGKAESVHFLMLPSVDDSRINKIAEARFKTLQLAVSLARLARERRKIRNNLPLKNVIVVASNESDIEALTYLKSYLTGEINAWNITFSTDTKLCALKTIPDFKVLGVRCGSKMKEVQKAINELTQEQILAFMSSGVVNLVGFELTSADLVVKRQFSGDSKVYEAAVSEDGSLVVAIDTTCDEEMLQELRASTLAAVVQKLRKSSGLVVSDIVEIFYEEKGDAIANALCKHAQSTVKRIKCLPLPVKYMPKYASIVAIESFTDSDLGKAPVKIYFTRPTISASIDAIKKYTQTESIIESTLNYLQTMDYPKTVTLQSIKVSIDKCSLSLTKGSDYFASALEMLKADANRPSWVPVDI
jgi:isoleucyl-tRNA synthetase